MSDGQPAATWSYQPGDWFGIVGPDITLLLPGSEKSRVTDLWELVDGGAGFDQVLDGLLSSGLSALSGFVLIGSGTGPTRLLLRGSGVRAGVVTGDGPVAVEGTATATWAERSFEGVTSLTVSVGPPEVEARHLPIEQGLVRVSRIDRPEHSPEPVADEVVESSPLDDDADTNAQPSPYAAELLTMAFDPLGAVEPVADGEEAAGLVPTLLPSLPPPPPPPPIAPAPADTAPIGTAPVDPVDDDLTKAGGDPDGFARQQPGVVRAVARLLVSNGETVDVDRVVLIGRAPEARRFTSTEQPRLITVPSPLHEISSTHVEVRPGAGTDHGSAVVTDLGSTNGTVLVQPDLGPEELRPGIAVQLIPGAVINLGDGVTIEVTRPS